MWREYGRGVPRANAIFHSRRLVYAAPFPQVLAIDATGLAGVGGIRPRFRNRGKHLLLYGPHSQPLMAMHRHGFIEWLGEENVCADLDICIRRAEELIAKK